MTNTLAHAGYCDGNHKSGEYLCKDEYMHRKALSEKNVMCAECGKDFPSLAIAEKHGKKLNHNIHG